MSQSEVEVDGDVSEDQHHEGEGEGDVNKETEEVFVQTGPFHLTQIGDQVVVNTVGELAKKNLRIKLLYKMLPQKVHTVNDEHNSNQDHLECCQINVEDLRVLLGEFEPLTTVGSK